MSDNSLALKYRPRLFSQVIGQQRVITDILNLFKTERAIPSMFLLIGPHGVGKTTIARLIAKRLNCLTPNAETGDACDTCTVCQKFNKTLNRSGNSGYSSYQEINAAETSGVDDMRSLVQNTRYGTSYKYNVIIIDEIHMLSKAAFQVLLKPTEEPVKNTVYVFCTTEVNKVPPTIQSRANKLMLTTVDNKDIARFLYKIIIQETGVKLDAKLVMSFVSMFNGHVRDVLNRSESIIDYLLVNKDKDLSALNSYITEEVIRKYKPADTKQLLQYIYAGDLTRILSTVPENITASILIEQLINYHMSVMIYLATKEQTDPNINFIYKNVPANLTIIKSVALMNHFVLYVEKLKQYLVKEDVLLLNCLLQAAVIMGEHNV